MAEMKSVQIHGWLKDVNDNFDELNDLVSGDVGLGALRVARWEFDIAEEDSAGELNAETGAHGTGVFRLPVRTQTMQRLQSRLKGLMTSRRLRLFRVLHGPHMG